MPARVLITTDAVGGVWQYTRDLVRLLPQAGYSVLVCILGPAATPYQLAKLKAANGAIKVEQNSAALEWMNDPWEDVDATTQWLLNLAEQFKPDVIHLNSYSYAAASWPAPILVVAHSCVSTWWQSVHQSNPGRGWEEYMRRVKLGLLRANAVVAPSIAQANDLKNFYCLDQLPVEVIYNASPLPISQARRKQPFCLAAGRLWDEAKNLALLEKVGKEIAWPIYVAGDGGKQNNEAAGCRYLGKLTHEKFLDYVARASLFLHPALYEPFGLVVLEAARMGCALFLADILSLRELWSGAAQFLPPRDVTAWVKAINHWIADEPGRGALSCRALTHSQRYSPEVQIRAYQGLYQRLITSHRYQQVVAV